MQKTFQKTQQHMVYRESAGLIILVGKLLVMNMNQLLSIITGSSHEML